MEDGATGVKLANAAVTASSSSNEIATSQHRGQEEELVQDLGHEQVIIAMVLL